MALTDGVAELLAHDAAWLQSARALAEPIKSSIIHCHPSVTHFFRQVDLASESLLSAYAPGLPASERQNNGRPLMDGKDVVIFVLAYVFLVCLSLLLTRGSAPPPSHKSGKPLMAKIGPTFVLQSIYNLAQVLLCGFLVLRVIDVYRTENYSLLCNRFNVPNSRMAEVTWVFYMLKYLDLLDTAFMILRGNWHQLSFLHLYHHTSVIFISWINASVGFDGDIYYVVLLNSFVHVVMYAYYLLASLNIPLARMMKMFVTQLQMAQFLSMNAHACYHIYWRNTCAYPVRVTIGYLFYTISLFLLFRNFSKKTYGSRSAKATQQKVKAA
ncbi:hypothetical protein Efla_005666 [Eimeria flavescens]